jgi:hypothetical protein
MAIKLYLGQEVAKRIGDLDSKSSVEDLRNMLTAQGMEGEGKWVDICGLFSPASNIEKLIDSVKTLKIRSVDELNENLKTIYDNYNSYSWIWCSNLIGQQTGYKPEHIPIDGLIKIIEEWKTNVVLLNNLILKDAEKEFDSGSKLGFGLDGDENIREEDFKAVRGSYEDNKFVTGLQKESKEIEKKADRLIAMLERWR